MARANSMAEGAATEATTEATAQPTSASVAPDPNKVITPPVGGATADNRSIIVTYDAGDGQGPKQYRRKDLILKLWDEGYGRGPISKAIGCSYQIVHAATKGVPGGPKKDEKAVPGATTPAAA